MTGGADLLGHVIVSLSYDIFCMYRGDVSHVLEMMKKIREGTSNSAAPYVTVLN